MSDLELRASDAEREGEVVRLREACAEGRLTLQEFSERVEEAYAARTRAELRRLRLTENPEGIDEAEEAALGLEQAVGTPPRLATPAYLDELGAATRRLEQALGDVGVSPFAEAMKASMGAVEELTSEIERTYKLDLT